MIVQSDESGRAKESSAGAGVGLIPARVRGRDRREGAPGLAGAIAWRLLGLLAMAVCVIGGVFVLTVVFVALS